MNSLRHLANLSQQLSQHRESKSYIREALFKVKELLLFDFCVLYEVRNVVQDQIILEVIQNIGNDSARPDLFERKKICLSLENPDPKFTNEVYSYLNLRTSNVPVSGRGSDIAGYFQTPQEWGHGFILSCDYVHGNHEVKDEDFYTFEIVCNMLMGALTRNFYAHLATHDTLTGCLNKKMIYDQLDRALYKCARSVDSWLSVAMIDIDHFKKINDNYGHLQGDSILEEFVKIIEKSIRS
jgi:GGDEF domain-containing protein